MLRVIVSPTAAVAAATWAGANSVCKCESRNELPRPPSYLEKCEANYVSIASRWPKDSSGMQGIPKRSWPDVQPEAAEIPALQEALDLCLKAGEKRANCRAERFVLATAWLCADRYAEALRAYREDDEDADSLCAMGQCYQYGTGVPQDDVLAVEYYRKAASMGHPQALYALGALYYVGDGDLEEDESEAVRHFALAAAQGHASAMYMLGDSLLDGIAGLQPDSDAAVRWLIAAGDKGHRGARSRVFALLAPRDDASPRQWDEKGFTDASRQTLRRRKTEQK